MANRLKPDPATTAPDALPVTAARLLARIRERRPKVHCLTNPVALGLSANVLLAVGAEPSLSGDAATVRDFVAATATLVVNLGMMDPAREAACLAAVAAARELRRPWLLDPVKVELSPARLGLARRLLALRPDLVRANAEEIAALAEGGEPAALARAAGTVVARTGAYDLVADGARTGTIANGSPLMAKVTAMGCAASALAGAFLAVESDPWTAAVAALLVIGVAGEIAALRARGPGSFAVELLDALHGLDGADLLERGRVR
jgi:hydroxyethylthiazole kinase